MDTQVDSELFKQALFSILLDLQPVREPQSVSTLTFFDNYKIPRILKDFLQDYSFDRPIKIGHLYFDRVNELEKENLEEENKNCINERLLIIGSGKNGDQIVIDLTTFTVGFVFHDELWEDTTVKARDVFIDLGLSIGQFYFNAATQSDTFPVDAYAAEDQLNADT